MQWNYWKCKVKKRHALKRKWIVVTKESEAIVCKAKNWKTAVNFAINFSKKMNQTDVI